MNNKINILSGLFCVFVALLVWYGWFTVNKSIIQIYQTFAPMQFNTALGFLLSGFGLITISLDKAYISKIFGWLASILGGLTLIQYFFGIDLKIDNFFVDGSTVIQNVSHVGRMAPNTAIGFLLSGFCLILHRNKTFAFAFAFAVFVLSLPSFYAYLLLDSESDSFLTITRMSVHTTICFFVFSLSTLTFLYSDKKSSLWEISPHICFVTLSFLIIYFWHINNELYQERLKEEFNDLILKKEEIIKVKFSNYIQALYGGVGFINASNYVSREEWKNFVKAYNLNKYLRGANGFGYIDYIKEENLESYIAKVRNDNAPDFVNHPETKFKDKFIIKYIEPEKINKQAIGLDIGFEKNRRAAAEKARDTGRVTLTNIIYLVQDNQRLAGFLLLAPVYKVSANLETIEDRRKNFIGWSYSPFMGRKFFADISEINSSKLNFEVFDGEKIDEDKLIYRSSELKLSKKFNLSQESVIFFADRPWKILWTPTEDYKSIIKNDSWIILSLGLLVSTLISLLIYFLSKSFKDSRKEADDAKGFSELILKHNPDLIFIKDKDFRIMQANEAFLKVYPKDKRDKVIGYTTLEEYSEEESNKFLEMDKLAFEEGYSETNEKIIFPDGKIRTLFTQKIRFKNSEGEEFILGLGRDITEKEILVEKLTYSNEQLARFAYVCSHDLKEPLRMIKSFSEKIEQHFGNKLHQDEKGKKYLNFIIDGADRAQQLISDILDYSQIENETKHLEKVNLNGLLSDIEANLKLNLEEKEGILEVDDMPEIMGNKTQLYQLFQNLINNSLKYVQKDKKPIVKITYEINNTHYKFCIEDNGIGIDEKYYDRIFEIFQRLHAKHKYQGSGVGLSICKKIVERHGGKIWVDSELEKGTRFYFTIKK